jgi:predicted AlkP superfamily pyrophosphatase or phosphodiesterase
LGKVILVFSDGLRYDVAVTGMGMLGSLLEAKAASLYKVIGELPSVSRPIYETLQTGLPVIEHGVVSNNIIRKSIKPNIFQLAHDAGMITAAAAYFWISELYNRTPYDAIDDREVDDDFLAIQHGRFYTEDDFPDSALFASAASLVRKYAPDYLLTHPMGMDTAGHKNRGDSIAYRSQAIRQDMIMAPYLIEWMEREYNILVTGDHGMNADGFHGGTEPEVREVPLFLIRPGIPGKGVTGEIISQLQIAPTVCKMLGISVPDTMKAVSLI